VTLTCGTSTHELTARTVILAAGLRAHGKSTDSGRRRTLVGVGAVVDPPSGADGSGVVDMVIDRAGYVGVAPLEDGRLTIASALRSDAIRRAAGPRELVRTILATAGLENLVGTETRMTGVPALHRHRVSVQDGRLLAIGDAAGFVEPITGEGMSWALATGAGVVPSADAIIRRGPDAARWDLDYRRMMRTRHLRCSLVGVGIRHPRLVRSALLASNLAPALRAPVLSGLVGRFDPAPEGAPA